MNQTPKKPTPAATQGQPRRVPAENPTAVARRQRASTAGLLIYAIAGVFLLTVIVGLLILILPSFRVASIEVKGNTLTDTQAIIDATGIEVGDEIFAVDTKKVTEEIFYKDENGDRFPYITGVKVAKHWNRVVITVIEIPESDVFRGTYGSYSYTVDRDYKVLEVSPALSSFPSFRTLRLPAVTGICPGEVLTFSDASADRTYIETLLVWFEDNDLLGRISVIDVSDKFNVSYLIDGNLWIVLGKVADLETKDSVAAQILQSREQPSDYAVIDVSDINRSTYRPLTEGEFLNKTNP